LLTLLIHAWIQMKFGFFSLYVSSSSVICQMTGPKPLPKWFLCILRSRASSFNWQLYSS